MSSKNLIICDSEKDYAVRIAAFLSEKKEYRFKVRVCSSYEQIFHTDQEKTDLYLIDESVFREDEKPVDGHILVLSGRTERNFTDNVRRINKYQSVNQLYLEILDIFTEEQQNHCLSRRTEERSIIGIYSPIRRTGQTQFALKKGQELSKNSNVLYINMETYAGDGGGYFEEEEQNMSSLLYYAKQREEYPASLLASLVKKIDKLDYIPPLLFSEDLRSVTVEEWRWLFDRILNYSIYDILILDIGDSVQNLFELFRMCDVLYLPIATDHIAKSKICQFENVMKKMGYAKEWERMIMCDIRGADSTEDFVQAGFVERRRR